MDENGICDEPRGRPRGRPRGKQRSRARVGSRTAKTTNKRRLTESDDEYEEDSKPETEVDSVSAIQFDKDCDISALEAPTFTTLDRGPPAPMLQLSWDHSVSLIGEKVLSPRIHSCDTCDKPILIYGRMIPCKHIFCLTCAKSEDRACSRCGERVIRVEQTGLGTVFMCNFTINEALCKRTYLSQRDLQAHIDHRHVKNHLTIPTKDESKELFINSRDPRAEIRPGADGLRLANNNNNTSGAVPANDPRSSGHPTKDINTESALTQFPRTFNPGLPPPSMEASSPRGAPIPHHHIPVMTASRTNLITVALHEPPESPFAPTQTSYPQPPPNLHHPRAAVTPHSQLPPPSHSLPPPTHPFNSPPPISQPPPPSHFPPPPAVTSTSYASSSFPLRNSSTSSSLHHSHRHQFSYSQSQASSTQQQPLIPFGAVPPPVATQFSTQWSTPPPTQHNQPPLRPVSSHPINHPPPPPGTLPRQHLLTSNPPQKGAYYR